ncbi:MAG: hypothetical protein U5R30_12740 [Deltaproteobacteria bacterium]|nr:hypothetical protein [Deltaproteobacteria bacterium]
MVEISDVAFGGRGLTKVNGLAVFVDQAAPLDQARIRIIRTRRKLCRGTSGRASASLAPPRRASLPVQRNLRRLQVAVLAYAKQLEHKRRHVVEALEHIGQLRDIPVHETIASPNIFHYRKQRWNSTFSESPLADAR